MTAAAITYIPTEGKPFEWRYISTEPKSIKMTTVHPYRFCRTAIEWNRTLCLYVENGSDTSLYRKPNHRKLRQNNRTAWNILLWYEMQNPVRWPAWPLTMVWFHIPHSEKSNRARSHLIPRQQQQQQHISLQRETHSKDDGTSLQRVKALKWRRYISTEGKSIKMTTVHLYRG